MPPVQMHGHDLSYPRPRHLHLHALQPDGPGDSEKKAAKSSGRSGGSVEAALSEWRPYLGKAMQVWGPS